MSIRNAAFPSNPLGRRGFLSACSRFAGASLGWAALPGRLARASEAAAHAPMATPRARRIVHIFAYGAPSHLDLFDPKPELARRDGEVHPVWKGKLFSSPFKFRPRGGSGTELSELLPRLGGHVDQIALIRSLQTDTPAHKPARRMFTTGNSRLVRPSFGAWVNYGLGSENSNLPGFIALDPQLAPQQDPHMIGSSFLPASFQGSPIDTSSDQLIEHLDNNLVSPDVQRRQLDLLGELSGLNPPSGMHAGLFGARLETFDLAQRMQAAAPEAFDLNAETRETQELYDVDSSLGRQLLAARRLLERGVRVVQVFHGNWDHHANLVSQIRPLAAETDRCVSGFLTDLIQRGLLDDTLVVWSGEFGRTPYSQAGTEGSRLGRDHNHRGFSCWLAGGGIKGGVVHGATDEFGYEAVQDPVSIYDLHATMLHLLGLNHEQLTYRYSGRDFRLTDVYGRVIQNILA